MYKINAITCEINDEHDDENKSHKSSGMCTLIYYCRDVMNLLMKNKKDTKNNYKYQFYDSITAWNGKWLTSFDRGNNNEI